MLRRLARWAGIVNAIANIAPVYERMNTIMSLLLGPLARVRGVWAASRVCGNRIVVDVGAGHGVSSELLLKIIRPGYLVLIEPWQPMAQRLKALDPIVADVVIAFGEHLPLRSSCCSLVSAFYSLRDFIDPIKGLSEMYRTAKTCILIVDLFKPRGPIARRLLELWVCRIVPLLAVIAGGELWRNYLKLCETLNGWMDSETLTRALSAVAYTALWKTGLGSIAVVLGVKP